VLETAISAEECGLIGVQGLAPVGRRSEPIKQQPKTGVPVMLRRMELACAFETLARKRPVDRRGRVSAPI
jgi:hypothetical protein